MRKNSVKNVRINSVKVELDTNNEIGDLTQRLYNELTGIQWGKVKDENGWSYIVCNG